MGLDISKCGGFAVKHYSTHKLEKALKRAERHKEWLKKNLPNTTQQRNNQKEILKLLTEIRLR